MAKNKKLTNQQQINKKEYNRLRNNLKKRMKRLSDKGYYVKSDYIEKLNIPSITELGHNPRKSDIDKLKRISTKYIDEAYYKTFYSEIGQPKEFSLLKARNIERSESSKKAAETRKLFKEFPELKKYKSRKKGKTEYDIYTDENGEIIDESDLPFSEPEFVIPADENGEIIDENDLPFSETETEEFPTEYKIPMTDNEEITTADITKTVSEEDIVLQNLDDILNATEFNILKLFGFKSMAKNSSKAKENEDFVSNKAQIVLDEFMKLKQTDSHQLAKNCQYYSMQIISLIDAIKYSYRDPRSFDNIFTDLINYFTGNPEISEEAAVSMESSFEYETGGEYIYD